MNLLDRLFAFQQHQQQTSPSSSAASSLAGISHLYWATFGRHNASPPSPSSSLSPSSHHRLPKLNHNYKKQNSHGCQSLDQPPADTAEGCAAATSWTKPKRHERRRAKGRDRDKDRDRHRGEAVVSYARGLDFVEIDLRSTEPSITTPSSADCIAGDPIVEPSVVIASDSHHRRPSSPHLIIDHSHNHNQACSRRASEDLDSDWVLLNAEEADHSGPTSKPTAVAHIVASQETTLDNQDSSLSSESTPASSSASSSNDRQQRSASSMALDKQDIELIRASWSLVRKDPPAGGLLLFKGLFTKFPQYLKFFPQFADLDLDRLQDNKRLLKHAVRVVDTVTYLVDTIGVESKQDELNDNLAKLVKSHLRRRIGLAEFKNLGIVLIDFICDVNHRQSTSLNSDSQAANVGPSAFDANPVGQTGVNNNNIDHSSSSTIDQSETMTDALDKLHGSSSLSSSSSSTISSGNDDNNTSYASKKQHQSASARIVADHDSVANEGVRCNFNNEAILDANALVSGWTKLYGAILDLVKLEESSSANNQL